MFSNLLPFLTPPQSKKMGQQTWILEFKSNIVHWWEKNGKNSTHLKILVKLIFYIHISIHLDFFFKCVKPQLVTVVLKVSKISLKPQFVIVVLQFFLEPPLVTVVL